jgi:CRISPR-associated protein Cmr1
MPVVLTANFRVLTPLFLGGPDANVPDLRASSIKAMLRQWYRAADPAAIFAERQGEPRREDRLFGGAGDGAGQSPVLIRVTAERVPEFDWSMVRLDQYNEGRGTYARNGLKYLSYPFHMRGNEERTAFDVGSEFKISFVVPRARDGEQNAETVTSLRRAWIASLWLLGGLGSLGSRSRRGFGSLEISNWSELVNGSDWGEEAGRLPDLSSAKQAGEWQAAFWQGRTTVSNWFGSFDGDGRYLFGHPHLGRDTKLRLLDGRGGWSDALNAAGRRLQDFRVRRQPDYDNVKRALQTGGPLRRTPERAAFGLPLTFRYSSLRGANAQFVPSDPNKRRDRHASLLRLKVVKIGDRFHPLFLRLSGAVPGREPAARLQRTGRDQRGQEDLEPASGDLLDQFMSELARG